MIQINLEVPKGRSLEKLEAHLPAGALNIEPSFSARLKTLVLKTHAGSLHSKSTSFSSLNTHLESHAGSIHGFYSVGNDLRAVASSGSVHLDLYFNADNKPEGNARVEASTHAGIVKVRLAAENYYAVDASYSTSAGSLDIIYPDVFQGPIEIESKVGSVKLHGEDLKIISRVKRVTGEVIKAFKGQHKTGSIVESTNAGSAKLRFE